VLIVKLTGLKKETCPPQAGRTRSETTVPWQTTNGKRQTANDKRQMANGKWLTANGKWLTANG
jgi:ribosome modulation factor